MTPSLITGCIWVVVATIVAFLPFRAQFPPGIALLLVVPFVLGWIALEHGVWVTLAGGVAFLSMFRRPFGHLMRHCIARSREAWQ